MSDRLLTTADVAARVRAPEATVRYWRATGLGPRGFKLGRRVLYKEGDVEAWIDAQAEADQAARPA